MHFFHFSASPGKYSCNKFFPQLATAPVIGGGSGGGGRLTVPMPIFGDTDSYV
jgi:hypothetical protein